MNSYEDFRENLLKSSFFVRFKSMVIGLSVFVVVLIGLSNSSWESVLPNFLLSIVFVVGVLPNAIKLFFPELKYTDTLDRFMSLPRKPEGLNFQVVMNYLGGISTVSFCYTALGFARYKLEMISIEYWPFVSAVGVLILLLMSTLCVLDLLYRSGLVVADYRFLKRLILIVALVGVAIFIQIILLKVGIEAVNQLKIGGDVCVELQKSFDANNCSLKSLK